jgi:formylglycine-generating enzyme required for sulfatase activity
MAWMLIVLICLASGLSTVPAWSQTGENHPSARQAALPSRSRVAPTFDAHRESHRVFRDRRVDGSDCPECPTMVVVPAGTFTMGATAEEEEREQVSPELRGRAQPLTEIRIREDFAVGRYEVTRGQYAVFVRQTRRTHPGGCRWQSPGFAQTDRYPAVCVNWEDAQAYVRWLSARTGQTYRLLTEAEWEYAARAGTHSARWWGELAQNACANENVADRSTGRRHRGWSIHPCVDGFAATAPVGSFRPNAFGLHDMLGNIAEWVEDCWNEDLTGRPANETAVTAARGQRPADCVRRVIRGGAWYNGPKVVRSGHRSSENAGFRFDVIVGFRVARTLTH